MRNCSSAMNFGIPFDSLAFFKCRLDVYCDVYYIDNMKQRSVNTVSGSFGSRIRELRNRRALNGPSYSLRQVAARCGVTPAYLSRVERDEVAPPGEDTLVKLAEELDENKDVLLALAGKISTDLRSAILSRPKLFSELIRAANTLPDHAVLKIVREVHDGEW